MSRLRVNARYLSKNFEKKRERRRENGMARLSSRAPSAHPHLNEINLVTSNFRPVGRRARDGKERRWKGLLSRYPGDARQMDFAPSLEDPPRNNECSCVLHSGVAYSYV